MADDIPLTVDDFLSFVAREVGHERWELLDGVPVMMAGGTEGHALILGNLLAALRSPAQGRRCRVMTGLLTHATDHAIFEPDVVLRCGPVDPRRRYADDPAVVFEVLPPATLRHDRGLRLERYREIPSLRQIVLVYQDSVRIESWSRDGDEWSEEATMLVSLDDHLAIPSIAADLPLSSVYEDVADALGRG